MVISYLTPEIGQPHNWILQSIIRAQRVMLFGIIILRRHLLSNWTQLEQVVLIAVTLLETRMEPLMETEERVLNNLVNQSLTLRPNQMESNQINKLRLKTNRHLQVRRQFLLWVHQRSLQHLQRVLRDLKLRQIWLQPLWSLLSLDQNLTIDQLILRLSNLQ